MDLNQVIVSQKKMTGFIVNLVEALPDVLFVATSQCHLLHHVFLVVFHDIVATTYHPIDQVLFDLPVALFLQVFDEADVVLVSVLKTDTSSSLLQAFGWRLDELSVLPVLLHPLCKLLVLFLRQLC